MPTLAVGNWHQPPARFGTKTRFVDGFTLLELLVVLAIMAVLTGGVLLALPPAGERALKHDGEQLAALLEAGRARARAAGLPLVWQAQAAEAGFGQGGASSGQVFRWQGMAVPPDWPQRWHSPETQAQSVRILLGPEPVLPAQQVVLFGAQGQRLVVASDGVQPFSVRVQP